MSGYVWATQATLDHHQWWLVGVFSCRRTASAAAVGAYLGLHAVDRGTYDVDETGFLASVERHRIDDDDPGFCYEGYHGRPADDETLLWEEI